MSADASSIFASRVPSAQEAFVHARSETQTDARIEPLSFMCATQFCYQKWVEPCQVCNKAVCDNHLEHSTHEIEFPIAAPQRVSTLSASVTSVIQHTCYTIELIVFS